MKRNQKSPWIHVIVIVLSLIFLTGIGIGSYILIQNVFKTESSIMEVNVDEQLIAVDATIDTQAINLIYEVHNEKVTQVLIEILNTDVNNMDYITVPGNTKLKLSADVEKKLEKYKIKVNENYIRLDEITEYFSNNAFQFGQMIIGDILGIDISYYTVIEKNDFVKYFVTDDGEFYMSKKKYEYEVQVLSETFKTKLRQFDVEHSQIIDEAYKEIVSSLNMSNKKKYIADFKKIDVDKIYNWHIIGKDEYGKFVIDEELNTKLLKFIINNKTKYKYTQDEYNNLMEQKLSK